MDPWELFCEACRIVVEERDVYLEVIVIGDIFLMQLKALENFDEEDEDNEQA